MGLEYLPTFGFKFMANVGKYSSPMDRRIWEFNLTGKFQDFSRFSVENIWFGLARIRAGRGLR